MTRVDQCQWIGPEQEGPSYKYTCACKPIEGRSYCEEHQWQVYQKGTHLARRKKDTRIADSVHLWESLFNEAVEELENEGVL